MPRRIVVSVEANKLTNRKGRWGVYKQHMCKWLIDTLQFELHAYEIAGQLEGQCVFTSTYRGAQITGWICTFDDKISACITSIRFDDGDGWRPGGGPRKPNFANLEIISGSSIRGDGRYWELDQEYGDDVIGAPGPLNGKMSVAFPIPVEQEADALTASEINENLPGAETEKIEQLPALIVTSCASIKTLLELLLARLSQSGMIQAVWASREQVEELAAFIGKISLYNDLLSKWFDASNGYGFIGRKSDAPDLVSTAAKDLNRVGVFISYSRGDASILQPHSTAVRLGGLERVLLAQLLNQLVELKHLLIAKPGLRIAEREVLQVLALLTKALRSELARDAMSHGEPDGAGHDAVRRGDLDGLEPSSIYAANFMNAMMSAQWNAADNRGPPLH